MRDFGRGTLLSAPDGEKENKEDTCAYQTRKNVPEDPIPAWLWQSLPQNLRDALAGAGYPLLQIEEICLRAGKRAALTVAGKTRFLSPILSGEDLDAILLGLCGGSLYAHTEEICRGYLLLRGGVRVGVAGKASFENGQMLGVREIDVLNIRLPHRLTPRVDLLCRRIREERLTRGLLLYAPPGVGKTTCLRALAAALSTGNEAMRVALIDTRGELEPPDASAASSLSVLTGYPKQVGIEIAVRTLNAQLLICDEIGGAGDADAILDAANCGVPLVASAHADRVESLLRRPGLRNLHDAQVFGAYIGLSRDGRGGFIYEETTWEAADALVQTRR